jgi:hypothetical protein
LRRIARENGIEISNEMTPNDIIDALRGHGLSSDAAQSELVADAADADDAEPNDGRTRRQHRRGPSGLSASARAGTPSTRRPPARTVEKPLLGPCKAAEMCLAPRGLGLPL